MSSMRKMFAVVILAAAAFGCHSKKPAATPPAEQMSPQTGATGGAAYGGQKPQTPPADKDAPKTDK
jgi:hypothetical protein